MELQDLYMALKIIVSVVIFLSVAMCTFSTSKVVADMQMQVARTAYMNREISMALIYATKAVHTNPFEIHYKNNLVKIKKQYLYLQKCLKKGTQK